MSKKKRVLRGRGEIEKAVVDYIESLDFPTTTGNIAEGVGINWYAASHYLNKLKAEGKLFHKKVGRQNQWWTEKVDEQRNKIRMLEKTLDEVVKGKDKEIDKLRRQIKGLEKRLNR